MQIHVVKEGDTLEKISVLYTVSREILVSLNEIKNPDSLVIGQTIVIPIWGSFYFVKPEDNLSSIAKKFNLPLDQILRFNSITNPQEITTGVRLYIPQRPRHIVNGVALLDTNIIIETPYSEVLEIGELLTSIALYSYSVDKQGELRQIQTEMEALVAAKEEGITPILGITNLKEDEFSPEVVIRILNSVQLQEELLNNIIEIMIEKGYKGLNIDFKNVNADNRLEYNAFLIKVKEKLHPLGYSLTTVLPPKTSENQFEGYDYAFHGKIVDYIFLNTKEWEVVKYEPNPVVSLFETKKVLAYAITKIPKEKIMMEIPLYGYNWSLPFLKGDRAKVINNEEAIFLADKYNTIINYDTVAEAPYFNYVDEEGKSHIVWFEDARSIQSKFNLVKALDIKGFFYDVLGLEFPQNWLLVEDNFIVRKA